jgi:hypothetical protein
LEEKEKKIGLETLARGALNEQFEIALKEIIANIVDPNTDWKAERRIELKLKFTPTEDRDFASVSCDVKTVHGPMKSIRSAIFVGVEHGIPVANEVVKQGADQITMDDNGKFIDFRDLKKKESGK